MAISFAKHLSMFLSIDRIQLEKGDGVTCRMMHSTRSLSHRDRRTCFCQIESSNNILGSHIWPHFMLPLRAMRRTKDGMREHDLKAPVDILCEPKAIQ